MAAILNSFSCFYPLLFFCFIQFSVLNCLTAAQTGRSGGGGGGFTAELIHRDSPLSPLYNPSTTKLSRLRNAFLRSFSRAGHIKQTLWSLDNGIQSQMLPNGGEYLMKASVGTPPVPILGIADTGSDLSWTQCKPCTQCFKQIAPYFDPQKSTTYRDLSCRSQACQEVGTASCIGSQNICQYRMSYGDNSYSYGNLAVETFTLGSSTSRRAVQIPNMVFGCGHNDGGTFNETSTGIIGLGGGSLSFVSQLVDSIHGKFSYCLAPLDESDSNATSKINFGDKAEVSGTGVVSTPIIRRVADTFYYLSLESLTVGNKSLAYTTPSKSKSADSADQGNIIIDSGTTLTFLPSDLYGNLESELKRVIQGKPTPDPNGFLSLCYSNINDSTWLPTITVKFTGADLELPPTSTFVRTEGGLVCLAFAPTDDIAIFGNLSQMNFLVGYDIVKNVLSFMPKDCSKYN